MDIIDLRKCEFDGQDVKNMVEAIAISESIEDENEKKEREQQTKDRNAMMKEWKEGV